MLFDYLGRAIERRKQFGYLAAPPEYSPIPPQLQPAAADAIASVVITVVDEIEEE